MPPGGTTARPETAPQPGGRKRMARLTPQELETYRRDGLVIPSYRLPDGQLAAMRAALDRLIESNPGVRPEQLISAHVQAGDGGEKVRGDAAFLDLARDPA